MVVTVRDQRHAATAAEHPLMVTGLAAGYGRRRVLHGVSLHVAAGELVGVIGANGSGKSTLIRAVMGLLPPVAGEVRLGGRPLAGMRAAAVARFAAVLPQSATLPAGFTGLEAVLLGRTPHLRLLQSEGPRDLTIAERELERCDAAHLAGRRTDAMSGGERQRILMARALAQEPRLLLLDEPTAHLDITHQAALFALLVARCREDGLAALAVIHDLTLAAQFCDRTVLLSGGRIVAAGPPEAVMTEATLSAAYGGGVRVTPHPDTGRPIVLPAATAPRSEGA